MSAPLWSRAAAGVLSVLVSGVALAVTGTVKDTEGKPLSGVKVCHFQKEARLEHYCVETDKAGYFDIVSTDEIPIRVHAEGYFAQTFPAVGHHEIVLERSPTLIVRLVDSDGTAIDEGEVWVVFPGATKKGPFPVNRAGVRISRLLEPGEVRVIGRAEGYEESSPISVELEAGQESEATLTLRKK